ncbi:MAG: amidohydrolase [Deltaproteobacteria bacterium]|uniref:amidohydrolase n=1 Tax=Desulfobacula sp. TaxID=2593537 RepID=UPI0019C71CEB|nr:amidohydrolase [Candidatus Desulfobacula maris]MBL6993770.1 amidohydrolase [Desulfobacula sp.]
MTDLIFFNANVITLDPAIKKANLVAVKNGRIQSVLSNYALRDLNQKQTRLVDCGGKTLLPGFCDAHFHLWASVSHLMTLDLSPQANVSSITDILEKIREYSKTIVPGSWIRASGYNEFYLAEKRHPTCRDLDKAARDHPVKLTHMSHHAHVLNSLALKQVGISRFTPEPPGGLIDRYTDTGEPNGVLFEMSDFLSERVPRISDHELNRGIKLLNKKLLSLGITSIHEASFINEIKEWESLCSIKTKKKFLPRITMAIGVKGFEKNHQYSCPVDKEQLKVSCVKIILDQTTGRLYPPQKELDRLVLGIHQSGLQASIHAIEQSAVESACNAIENALDKIPNENHRHRIEHCSLCSPSLAKRLAALKIIVVTQPSFIHYNGDRYLKTIAKEDIAHLYPIATLQKSGVLVAGSSDSPIVEPNPITGIYSAISRMAKTGKPLSEKESIDTLSAIQMFTLNAAKAFFDEDMKGSITPGKLADMVLLSKDVTRLSSEEIKDINVVMTIIEGKIVWESHD